jgi:hypothetical protein
MVSNIFYLTSLNDAEVAVEPDSTNAKVCTHASATLLILYALHLYTFTLHT